MTTKSRSLLGLAACALAACSSGSDTNRSGPADDPVVTPINQIQGSGSRSPRDNMAVSIVGIVTGDFQNGDANQGDDLGGFFVQEANADSDPSTSEGVFVYDGNSPDTDVSVGDQVAVEGTVNEHFGETQISAASVTVTGRGSVQAVDVNLPANLEQFEGMLVRLPQDLTVASLYELERFGTVQLVAGGRPFTYTNQHAPDVSGYAENQADLAARSILLDDGRIEQNLDPIRYLHAGTTPDYSIRSGDTATGLTGNLRFARGSGDSGNEGFRLMPTVEPEFDATHPRSDVADSAGALRVVAFNALNFFSTVDAGQDNCGPSGMRGCRGANSAAELERQLAKLATTLHMIDADIVGLMEVENNDGTALQLLVDRLNTLGNSRYAFVDAGTVGTDVITTAFIYQPDSVRLHGRAVVLDSRIDMRFDETRNRPSVAQAFAQESNGATLSVIVNHLKSKGSSCADGGDPDLDDGQANCNVTRTQAALALANWITTDPTASGDTDYLLIGDLNAFVYEDPLSALKNGGLVNLLEENQGGAYWSSIFAGESGALDHALATSSLASQVVRAFAWHINADEPRALDYNLEFGRNPALFDPDTPYRSSDHDPIIVDLDLTN